MTPPNLAGHLATIDARLGGIEKSVAELASHTAKQNHRLDKIEDATHREAGAREERLRWEAKEAARLKTTFALGMSGAGIVSGIVFGSLRLLLG